MAYLQVYYLLFMPNVDIPRLYMENFPKDLFKYPGKEHSESAWDIWMEQTKGR